MVAKAARVKTIAFACEITGPPGNKNFLIKKCSNPGLGLIDLAKTGACANGAGGLFLATPFLLFPSYAN